MKKVLFIMPDLPGGGAEKVLIDILRHWDYERCAVTLLLEFATGVYVGDIPRQVELKVLPASIRAFRKASRMFGKCALSGICGDIFKRKLRSFAGSGYDAIISFMEGPAVKLHSFLTDNARRNLSWVHIDMTQKHWSEAYFSNLEEERACYAAMDSVVFVSEQAKRGFESIFGNIGGERSVIYNLIDAEQIRVQAGTAHKPTVPSSPFVISMAGRLNRQKRYDRALEAAAILKKRGCDFELRIAGDGGLLPEMKEMAAQLGIEEKVRFLGFRKPAYADMAAGDVFLNSSEAEGYPLTLCEALCLGLPVVATDVSGAREILGENEYGIVVPQSPEAIADALMALYGSPSERKRMQTLALRRSGTFDVPGTMEKIYSKADV